MKEFKGTKPKEVSLRKEKTKYNIGTKYTVLYDDIPQATVETCIGHHTDEQVLANAKLFAASYKMLLSLKILAAGLKAGEEVKYETLEKIISLAD